MLNKITLFRGCHEAENIFSEYFIYEGTLRGGMGAGLLGYVGASGHDQYGLMALR
jgi:hypothetical protein